MKTFERDIKTAIIRLKQLHKKNASSAKKMTLFQLDHFKIKQKEMRKSNLITLYYKANLILDSLDQYLTTTPNHKQEKGLEDYYYYLTDLVNQYYINNNKIFHKERFAASTLIDCIQLCNLPITHLNEKTSEEIKEKTIILCEIGSNQVLNQLLKSLQDNSKRHEFFFMMQISYLRAGLKRLNRRLKPVSSPKTQKH